MSKKSLVVLLIVTCLALYAFQCKRLNNFITLKDQITSVVLFKGEKSDSIAISTKEDILKLHTLTEYIKYDDKLNDGRQMKMSTPLYTIDAVAGDYSETLYIWSSSVKMGQMWLKYKSEKDKEKVFSIIQEIIAQYTLK